MVRLLSTVTTAPKPIRQRAAVGFCDEDEEYSGVTGNDSDAVDKLPTR